MPLEKILNLSDELDFSLVPYPVGDLVSKLSNFGPENIIHKDKINFDKNKNLKLSNFFIKKKEDLQETQKIREEGNINNDDKLCELNVTGIQSSKSKILDEKNFYDFDKICTDIILKDVKNKDEGKKIENIEAIKEELRLNDFEINNEKITCTKESNPSNSLNINENLLDKTKKINLSHNYSNKFCLSEKNEKFSQKNKIYENTKLNEIESKNNTSEIINNKENKTQLKRKSDASVDPVLSTKHKKLKKESNAKKSNTLENFLNMKKVNHENK
jgi:hypothetical protein